MNRPLLQAALKPVDGSLFVGPPVIAFAGIGRPEKFFASLRGLGVKLIAQEGFPDHHKYRAAELATLRRDAARAGALLITTAKDWVRLSAKDRADIAVLDVELRWRDETAMQALLAPLLGRIGDGGNAARA